MKLIKYTTAAALLSGIASAQGLFDVNPNESDRESSPLRYTVGVTLGYDDNTSPTNFGPEISSTFLRANLDANMVVRDPQTSWDLNASVGVSNYFDDLVINGTTYNARLALNLSHRFNDRLRFVSRNFGNYGLDLANQYGPLTSRDVGEYTYFSSDNSIGYRLSDRLASYTGIIFSGLDYDDSSRDVDSFTIYNQFRYTLNQQTTLTAAARYAISSFEVNSDVDRLTTTVGVEHRLSEVSSVTANVGAQFSDNSSAYGSLSYVHRVNSRLNARLSARYSQEDTDTVFLGGRYNDKTTFRLAAAAEYSLFPRVSLTLGGSYTSSDYQDGGALVDTDWELFNIYVGASYMVNDAISVTASANHTTSDAPVLPNRDYSRNRYDIGIRYSF